MLTKSNKKQTQRRRTFWLITLLVISFMTGGWWLWRQKNATVPRFEFLSVRVNNDSHTIFPGQTLSLHPQDRVKILDISTNIPLNLNVRLSAKGFDVNALRYETLPIVDLLPQQEPFDRYRFVIHAKHCNQNIGEVVWVVQPYAEDWFEKADRIIDTDRRIALLEKGLSLLPGNALLHRRLVDEYMALKQWKKAASMLEQMAEKKKDGETLSELLSVYREMNDTTGMLRVLKILVDLDPDHAAARKAYAEMLEQVKNWGGAIEEYQALLKQMNEGDRLDIYKRLGYLYTQMQDHEKAIDVYLKAAKLDQKDANLHYNLSYLYETLGQKDKADFYLDNAVTLKSEDIEGRLKLAHRLVEKGDIHQAREHLSEVLEQRPNDMKVLALFAQVLEMEGDKKALKSVYQKILSLNPTDNVVVYNLGAIQYEAGNLKDALSYFKTYLAANPEDADVHGLVFDIYQKEKDLPNAFKEAVTIVELKPREADTYGFIVEYLTQKGDYETLIPLIEKGLKARPDSSILRKDLISAYLKSGREDPAVREMEILLSEQPQDVGGLIQEMFEVLQTRKAYVKLTALMKKAVDVFPQDAAIRGYLIFASLKTGKNTEAMEQMEAILKIRPNDLDLWLQLARLREQVGDPAGAARAYRRALDLSPEHPEASEAYLMLRLKGVGQGGEE